MKDETNIHDFLDFLCCDKSPEDLVLFIHWMVRETRFSKEQLEDVFEELLDYYELALVGDAA